MAESDGVIKPHAIMVESLFQGRITPFIHLAVALASKGCTVTYVQTELNHHLMSKASTTQQIDSIFLNSGLDIRRTTVSYCFPLDFDRDLNFLEFYQSILRDFPARIDELVGKIVGGGGCHFLVADTSYLLPPAVAARHRIVNVSFWTSPAIQLSIGHHLELLKHNVGHSNKAGLPNSQLINRADNHILILLVYQFMEEKGSNFRALLFPWLGHGHVFPYLELAKKLSKRNFHVYLCSTSIILDSVKNELSDEDDVSIELVHLNLPELPELPPHYHTTKNLPSHLFPTLVEAFEMSRSSFHDIITNLKPDLLIYDAFQPWSAKFASSQGIPTVHFSTVGATILSFFIHAHLHASNHSYPYPEIFLREFERSDRSSEAGAIEVNETEQGFAFLAFQLSCDILLVKSCRGLEGKYMDYLSTLCKTKVVPTGPLVSYDPKKGDAGDEEIMNWLSQKSQFSTLYISFGSESYLSRKQIHEIAKGRLRSYINFIWVVRTPVGSEIVVEEALPEGFLEGVKERGMLVKGWAPQAAILAHPSVGGFMSHCGWSSVTESVYFAVPIVAVPLKLDQPVGCRLVVDAGVGVEVMRDENGEFVGEEVERVINEVITGKRGERLRARARELSEKMKVEEKEEFDQVAEELSRLCAKKSSALS